MNYLRWALGLITLKVQLASWIMIGGLAYMAGAAEWAWIGKLALLLSGILILFNYGLAVESTSLRNRLRECDAERQQLRRKLTKARKTGKSWQMQALQWHNCAMGWEESSVESMEDRQN